MSVISIRRGWLALQCVVVALAVAAWQRDALSGCWATAAVASAFLLHVPVLVFEFACMASVNSRADWSPPPIRSLLACLLAETWLNLQVFCYTQLFGSNGAGNLSLRAASKGDCCSVILVHGYFCSGDFWTPTIDALANAGIAVVAPSLSLVARDFDASAAVLEAHVQRLLLARPAPVVVVGHSLGGLLIRHWYRTSDHVDSVRRIITIGTPHHGTWLARFGISSTAKRLRIGSPWLGELNAASLAQHRLKTTCFYSDCDNVVFPFETARLPGAVNSLIPHRAHMHLARDHRVLEEIIRWASPDPETMSPVDAPRPPA